METYEWRRFLGDNSSAGIGGGSNDGGAAGPNDPAPGAGGQGDFGVTHCASCSANTPNHFCPTCKAHYVGPGTLHKKKKRHQ